MSKKLAVLCGLLLLASCSDPTAHAPSSILSVHPVTRATANSASPCLGCVVQQSFARATGEPIADTLLFSGNPAWPYTICIDDGGSQGANATVVLNGDTLYRNGGHVHISVRLATDNTLIIRLTGKPGSTLAITLQGPPPVASVTVTPDTARILTGSTMTFTATLTDADGNALTDRPVTWSSSDASIAAVDQTSGVVIGEAPGTATVTATSEGQVGIGMVIVLPPTHTITLIASGNGSGTVISSPAGINCSMDSGVASGACSMELPAGEIVTLTAADGDSSQFAGFTGGIVSNQTTGSLILDSATSVTAKFWRILKISVTVSAGPIYQTLSAWDEVTAQAWTGTVRTVFGHLAGGACYPGPGGAPNTCVFPVASPASGTIRFETGAGYLASPPWPAPTRIGCDWTDGNGTRDAPYGCGLYVSTADRAIEIDLP